MSAHKKNPRITDIELYQRLLGYLKPHMFRFTAGMLAAIPASALNGALAFLIGPFIDELMKKHNYNVLFMVPVVVLAAGILQGVCEYVSNYYTNYVGTAISQHIRLELYRQLSRMDIKYLNTSKPGDLLSRYYEDPSRLQQAIVTNLETFVVEFFSMLFLASVLIYRSWTLALIAIVIISSIIIPIQIISKKLRKLDHQNQHLMAGIYDIFNESVSGSKVIAIFGLQKYQLDRFENRMRDYFGNSMRLARADAILKPLLQFIASIGISLILLFGSFNVQNSSMTPGDLTSFLVALVLLYKPVKTVGGILTKIQRVFAPAERVFEKLDLEPAITDPENAIELKAFESITFENVQFSYEPGNPILKNINLHVQSGETVALVGESGGGKSTLIDLIPRFMDPDSGSVRINAMDLKQVSLPSLRNLIAVVSQDTILFEGNIIDNIRLGNVNATEADIEKAIEVAHLSDVLKELPQGLETRIGSRGILLSGGQKQRIAIARAFLKNAPVIIMDEATSALDNASEAAVQDGMNRLMAGKTVFVIAHRLSTVRHANRILVMQQGQIAEEGTHDDLLARQGIYHRLYNLQFRHEPDFASA